MGRPLKLGHVISWTQPGLNQPQVVLLLAVAVADIESKIIGTAKQMRAECKDICIDHTRSQEQWQG